MPQHVWPTGQPIRKAPRTCTVCGLTVTWIKPHDEWLTKGVYCERGGESQIVSGLRNVPGCIETDVNNDAEGAVTP